MQDREHDDDLVLRSKIQGVRESVQQRSPYVAGHDGKLQGPLADAGQCLIDIAEESFRETGSFVLVPLRSVLEIGLGK